MNIINKLLPKNIVETNLKRLSRFLDLTQDPYVPLENPDESDQIEAEKKTIPHDHWFDDNPRPEEEIADNYASRHEYTPDFEKTAEEVVTMHEKMYRIATAKYNPFAIGGSEQLGGSEEWHDSKPG